VPGLIASIACRLVTCKLGPSVGGSGPHDLAVRGCAARHATQARPSHPRPAFVTTRSPLSSRRDGRRETYFLKKRNYFIFRQGLEQKEEIEGVGEFSFLPTAFSVQGRSNGGKVSGRREAFQSILIVIVLSAFVENAPTVYASSSSSCSIIAVAKII
jgi:hypothetical protein